jgi:predicted enzyme related to lactoylglutathione lyase
VWERGAGETASSGSSATAASAVAVARGWCVSPVTVHLPGGELVVTLAGDGASLLGPVAEICRGSVWLGTPATAGTTVGVIGWTDITVEDADRLRDFCAAVLGWSYEGVEMGGYADWAMLAADGTPVAGVCSARGVNAGLPATWLPYVEVADLEVSLARCRERGGTVVHERGEAGGERMAVIRDPSGAALALTQRAAR